MNERRHRPVMKRIQKGFTLRFGHPRLRHQRFAQRVMAVLSETRYECVGAPGVECSVPWPIFRRFHDYSADTPAQDSTPHRLVRPRTQQSSGDAGKSDPHRANSNREAKMLQAIKTMTFLVPAEGAPSAGNGFPSESFI